MTDACVIFDIDGTLVDSAEFEGPSYITAVRRVLGNVAIRSNWDYEHITDSGILRQICAENGFDAAQFEQQVRTHFGELIADHIRRKGACQPILGALRLLNELRSVANCQIGIATGGWGHTAGMKLKCAGFDISGLPLSSSDDGFERIRIMERCRALMAPTRVTTYVGDGEWDKKASELLGWRFIGIGNRLRGKCQHWLPDFSAPRLLATLLG